MSPSTRPRLGGTNGYHRPSLDVLDDLTNPGTPGPRDDRQTRGTPEPPATRDIVDTSGTGGTSDTRVVPGTPGSPGPSGAGETPGTAGTSSTPANSASPGTLEPRDSSVTEGTPGDEGVLADSGTSGTLGTRGTLNARGARKGEPRDHVKLARSLADEMRDAVWFLSEHGRPRVQLGELLDEAVRSWLDATKARHNQGEQFPVRGRLR